MDLERAAMVRGRGRSVGRCGGVFPPSLGDATRRRPLFSRKPIWKVDAQPREPTDRHNDPQMPPDTRHFLQKSRPSEGGSEGGNGKNKRHRSITRKTVVRPSASVGSLFFRSADRHPRRKKALPPSSIHSTRGGGLDARPHKKNTTAERAIHPVARNDTYQK